MSAPTCLVSRSSSTRREKVGCHLFLFSSPDEIAAEVFADADDSGFENLRES